MAAHGEVALDAPGSVTRDGTPTSYLSGAKHAFKPAQRRAVPDVSIRICELGPTHATLSNIVRERPVYAGGSSTLAA